MNSQDNSEMENIKKDRVKIFNESFLKNGFGESQVIAKSILGKDIWGYKIGYGKRIILAVGAHHALEYITAAAMYEFLSNIEKEFARGATCYGINTRFLLQKFTFWIVPCLNPDGVGLHLFGTEGNPLSSRQIKMNGGGEIFSEWQSNARGVDLNHNYNYGFYEYKLFERIHAIEPGKTKYSGEYPESEPETSALASLVRMIMPSAVISFHTQGREIFFAPDTPKLRRISQRFAKAIGYMAAYPTDSAMYGGLCDYTGYVLDIPSFTVELGKGKNPLPYSDLPLISETVKKCLILLPTYL